MQPSEEGTRQPRQATSETANGQSEADARAVPKRKTSEGVAVGPKSAEDLFLCAVARFFFARMEATELDTELDTEMATVNVTLRLTLEGLETDTFVASEVCCPPVPGAAQPCAASRAGLGLTSAGPRVPGAVWARRINAPVL